MLQNRIQFEDTILNTHDTELMCAIIADDMTTVSSLISKGLDINETNNSEKTALHIAVEKQNLGAVKVLLKQDGINVDAVHFYGVTALILACTIRDTNIEIIQMLLQHGCCLHDTDFEEERSAIHFAVEVCSLEIVKLLIENGADINTQDINCDTALHIAMRRRDVEMVAMLLYYNADTSIANIWDPPIQEAKTPDMRELLLPYTDLCNEDVLYGLDIATMRLLWVDYQSKGVFAQWLLEDIETRMRFSFVPYKVSRRQMCQFIHELFEDEDMQEVMYQPETSACLLELILSRTVNLHRDDITADMLRLLLSNFNVLKMETLRRLQHVTEFSPLIIRVLEDLDVIIEYDLHCKAYFRTAERTPWPLLWRMFCTPRIDLEKELLQNAQNKIAQRFYAIGKIPSLLELCRNKIRDDVLIKYAAITPNKPFHYASVLKPLAIPSVMIDVLLLRKPLYSI